MDLSAEKIKDIYSSKVATKYDLSMNHFFARLKRKAFKNSSIDKGDIVVVFCCGTGLDFPHVLKKIGNEGRIIGIDFSDRMLEIAQKRIWKERWNNIELKKADITQSEVSNFISADAGVCTLGLSIIPEYEIAYENLLSNVKSGGEIIIGDMQLAKGRMSIFNPITVRMAKRYGGTFEGHQNSQKIITRMKGELIDNRMEEFFFNSYFYCAGIKS